jgi:hypothetical protein
VRPEQLRGVFIIFGAGAVLALINLLGTLGAAVGLGLMILGLVLSAAAAPPQHSEGVNWWSLLAAGTALVLAGVPLQLAWELGGGLLVAAGGALGVIGVALGWP